MKEMTKDEIRELATEALMYEGNDAYFGSLEADQGVFISVLTTWLDTHRDSWYPAGEDYSWSCTLTG